MESPWPPPGCWSCGTLPREEVLRHQSVLQARTAAEGGPFTRFLCPDCGLETVVEEVPGGDPVLAPPEPGNAALSAFLDGKEGFRVRSRARSWFLRWGEALEELRRYRAVTRRAGGRPPEPGPARGR
ncbi:MAG: hypothetical protein L6R43_11345, partial [Planctomycetes bacterium]|nr:hypothetical protein [Planctomycetota bacterium]